MRTGPFSEIVVDAKSQGSLRGIELDRPDKRRNYFHWVKYRINKKGKHAESRHFDFLGKTNKMMCLVHPRLGVRVIGSLDAVLALTRPLEDWTMSDEADIEFRLLWLDLAGRLSNAGASSVELDLCANTPERVRECPGWTRYPKVAAGPWSRRFAIALGDSAPCWMLVHSDDGESLMVLDGGFDRMIVLSSRVNLNGLIPGRP